MLNFNPNGRWEAFLRYPPRLTQSQDLRGTMEILVKEIQEVPILYKNFMSNDGQLIGQEKANLVTELTDILSSLVFLVSKIPHDQSGLPALAVETIGYSFSTELKESDWTGQGIIGSGLFKQNTNFAQRYQTDLTPQLQQVIRNFSLVMSSPPPHPDAVKNFYESVQNAMAGTLCLIYGLQFNQWNK